jgi:hypothetical protein
VLERNGNKAEDLALIDLLLLDLAGPEHLQVDRSLALAGEGASHRKTLLAGISNPELSDRLRIQQMLERLRQCLQDDPPAPDNSARSRCIGRAVATLGPAGEAPEGLVPIPVGIARRA